MSFRDLYPHRSGEADDFEDEVSGQMPDYSGRKVVYRLGFQSMEIDGMPDCIELGRVAIHQVDGPVLTQRTWASQRAGVPLVFDKHMETGIEVGRGLRLSICQITGELVPGPVTGQLNAWRNEVLTAVGLLASFLDERIAQEELFEDLIVYDAAGAEPKAGGDVHRLRRHFLPYPVHDEQRAAVDRLAATNATTDNALSSAARWYLRGVRMGPQPDAIVSLWTAIEALLGPSGNRRRQLEEALTPLVDLSAFTMSVAQLVRLRAAVVHHGNERPDRLDEGYYHLEGIIRILMRAHLDDEGAWPINPDPDAWDPPANQEIREMWSRPPKVEWY